MCDVLRDDVKTIRVPNLNYPRAGGALPACRYCIFVSCLPTGQSINQPDVTHAIFIFLKSAVFSKEIHPLPVVSFNGMLDI